MDWLGLSLKIFFFSGDGFPYSKTKLWLFFNIPLINSKVQHWLLMIKFQRSSLIPTSQFKVFSTFNMSQYLTFWAQVLGLNGLMVVDSYIGWLHVLLKTKYNGTTNLTLCAHYITYITLHVKHWFIKQWQYWSWWWFTRWYIRWWIECGGVQWNIQKPHILSVKKTIFVQPPHGWWTSKFTSVYILCKYVCIYLSICLQTF